jgi:hypothetical protein
VKGLVRRLSGCLLCLAFGARLGEASGGEIALVTGPASATYKQTLTFSGGAPQAQLARLTVKESPSLEASSGLAVGLSATLFLSNAFGLEGRVDSADVDLQSFGGSYTLELGPPGSPVSSIPVTLGAGETDLRRVRPLSLNLRFQSQGRVGVGLSFGGSYLPSVDLDAVPTVTVANLSAAFPVSLTATPVNAEETRHLGFNGGVTLQIKIASGFSILGEARGFTFRRSELKWTAKEEGSLSVAERALLANIVTQLESPRFTPGFWAVRVGAAYRF